MISRCEAMERLEIQDVHKPELTKLKCDQRNYDKQWSMVKRQFWCIHEHNSSF
jgi:hypothetical protein